jgi:predicted 2-oxoglutarate/Fe(II)-dependent dioxygenase YbiX
MSTNLKDYLKVYDNFIELELCENVVKSLNEAKWQLHSYYNVTTNTSESYENHELSVSNENIPEKSILDKVIWNALHRYIYDFPNMHRWFCAWSGYSLVRFNRYDPSTQMRLHCDHIHSLFDGTRKGIPMLTVLGGLNDDYTGGELVMWDSEVIKLPAGAVAVFPSNFLYPHEVLPVKEGIRYSYVSWAW